MPPPCPGCNSRQRQGRLPRLPAVLHYAMPLDIDIWRSANVLVKGHREDAPIRAAMQADAMLAKGDLDGYAVWKRIIQAIEELQVTAPAPGMEKVANCSPLRQSPEYTRAAEFDPMPPLLRLAWRKAI